MKRTGGIYVRLQGSRNNNNGSVDDRSGMGGIITSGA